MHIREVRQMTFFLCRWLNIECLQLTRDDFLSQGAESENAEAKEI